MDLAGEAFALARRPRAPARRAARCCPHGLQLVEQCAGAPATRARAPRDRARRRPRRTRRAAGRARPRSTGPVTRTTALPPIASAVVQRPPPRPLGAGRARASASSMSGNAIHRATGRQPQQRRPGDHERRDPRGVGPPAPRGASTGRSCTRTRERAPGVARARSARRPATAPRATRRPPRAPTSTATTRSTATASTVEAHRRGSRVGRTGRGGECVTPPTLATARRAAASSERLIAAPRPAAPGTPHGPDAAERPGGSLDGVHPPRAPEVLDVRRPARPAPRPRTIRPHVRVVVVLITFLVTLPRVAHRAGWPASRRRRVTDLPADHLAFSMPAGTTRRSSPRPGRRRAVGGAWAALDGVASAEPLGRRATTAGADGGRHRRRRSPRSASHAGLGPACPRRRRRRAPGRAVVLAAGAADDLGARAGRHRRSAAADLHRRRDVAADRRPSPTRPSCGRRSTTGRRSAPAAADPARGRDRRRAHRRPGEVAVAAAADAAPARRPSPPSEARSAVGSFAGGEHVADDDAGASCSRSPPSSWARSSPSGPSAAPATSRCSRRSAASTALPAARRRRPGARCCSWAASAVGHRARRRVGRCLSGRRARRGLRRDHRSCPRRPRRARPGRRRRRRRRITAHRPARGARGPLTRSPHTLPIPHPPEPPWTCTSTTSPSSTPTATSTAHRGRRRLPHRPRRDDDRAARARPGAGKSSLPGRGGRRSPARRRAPVRIGGDPTSRRSPPTTGVGRGRTRGAAASASGSCSSQPQLLGVAHGARAARAAPPPARRAARRACAPAPSSCSTPSACADHADQATRRSCSGGQRQRVAIARALVGRAPRCCSSTSRPRRSTTSAASRSSSSSPAWPGVRRRDARSVTHDASTLATVDAAVRSRRPHRLPLIHAG